MHPSYIENALTRFDQVQDVSDSDRDLAFNNSLKAAEHYDIHAKETGWRDLGKAS
jgi:hypothetical protein